MRNTLRILVLMPSLSLALFAQQPSSKIQDWIGWYRTPIQTPGKKNDRLLLTRGKEPGTIHVSGRAYWYGINDVVHFGSVNADGIPSGSSLHVVEGDDRDDPAACRIDFVLNPLDHTLSAEDNSHCGGMNVTFRGKWVRFTPATRPAK